MDEPRGQCDTDGNKRRQGIRRNQVGTMRNNPPERSQGWAERWGMKTQRPEGREKGGVEG